MVTKKIFQVNYYLNVSNGPTVKNIGFKMKVNIDFNNFFVFLVCALYQEPIEFTDFNRLYEKIIKNFINW